MAEPSSPNPAAQLKGLSREKLDLLIRKLRGEPGASGSGAGAAKAATGITRERREGPQPVSSAQQRLWFLDQLEPGSPAYNMTGGARLRSTADQPSLDRPALGRALDEVVRRHEALRTTFGVRDGQPVQVIGEPSTVALPLVDLAGLPAAAREAEVRRAAAAEALRPFDLVRGPLLRTVLLRVGPTGAGDEHVLLFGMHHIVSDGWSMGIFLREVGAGYAAFKQGGAPALPELPVQYADYARWQRAQPAEALAGQLAWWRTELAGAPTRLELPADHPPSALGSPPAGFLETVLPADLQAELADLGRREGYTPFMLLLAAFGALLARRSGQDDLLVGSPIANRRRLEIEGLIGFFVNTLVLRVDLKGDPAGGTLLERVRAASTGAFDHPDAPFEKLVEELAPERDLAHAPLVQVLFAFQNTGGGAVALPGLTLEPLPHDAGAAKLDLILTGSNASDTEPLRLVWEYSRARFEPATVERLAGHFERLLAGLLRTPERPVADLPILSPAEEAQLVAWSAGVVRETLTPWVPVPRSIAEQAARTPEAVAVEFDRSDVAATAATAGGSPGTLTYRELTERAGCLAGALRERGVGPGAVVAVALERSPDLIVALLGVWQAGAAYLPLDPGAPRQRLAGMLADAGVAVVLAAEETRAALPADLAVLSPGPAWDGPPAADGSPPAVAPDDLAYVLFTSGSTGRPKGVAIPHRALANHMAWMLATVPLGAEDRVFQKTPLVFDASVWEVWLPLMSGARLVLAQPGGHQDPAYLAEAAARRAVTVLQVVPSLLQALLAEPGFAQVRTLRHLFCGGEALAADLAARFFERFPGTALHNLYGPTEVCIESVWWTLAPDEPAPVPIGRPIDNLRAHLLDRRLHRMPPGVPGELCLGGPGLARGYAGRPDLTAERFVPDSFGEPGSRLYRTGDLARYRPDGVLEYLGRIDAQVKIRGVRIELGEIEAVLATLAGVREAAVAVHQERLIAGVVTAPAPENGSDGGAPDPAAWKADLRDRLPESMIPAAFVSLPALPRTAGGKVDRRALAAALAATTEAGAGERPSIAPRTDAERLVAGIWAEVLGRPRVGVEDDFFDLGGHSLLATQVVLRLREALGVDLRLRTLFEAPTVEALARAVEQAAPVEKAPGGAGRDDRSFGAALSLAASERYGLATGPRRFPASFAEERLWFLDQLDPGSSSYNIAMGVRLSGRLAVPAFAAALTEIARRHGTLRTTFEPAPGGLGGAVQVIHPAAEVTVAVPVIDLTGLAAEVRTATAKRLADLDRRPFDLAAGPLFRVALLRLAAEEHLVLLTMHHIISDGWSMGVFVRELAALYGAYLAGKPSPLPPLTVQYADISVWQRSWLTGEVLERQLAYWRQTLAAAPAVLELPTDRPRPTVQTFAGARLRSQLPPDLMRDLGAAVRGIKGTLFMGVLAGFQALLGRLAGQDDLVVGSPIANRQRVDTEPLIGFFVNTLALRGNLSGDPTFGELLNRVREVTLGAYAHQDVPFEKLVEELAPERSLGYTPLFQVLLVLQNAPQGGLKLPGLTLEPVPREDETAKFDLTLAASTNADSGLDLVWEYNRDLFDAATVVATAERFARLLRGALADPAARLSELPLLSETERRQVVGEWARPVRDDREYPRDRTIAELFAAQVAATPDAEAVVFAGEPAVHLTYRELAALAARVARRLRSWGVGPEVPVALALERSAGMVAATLGVLQAGGAYLPLDPSYPQDRLAFMLEDAQGGVPRPLLLTEARRTADFAWAAESGVRIVALEEALAEDGREGESLPDPGIWPEIGPDSLAYIMYTSGSTGRPKGVAAVHRAVVRLVRENWFADFGPDKTFLQLAPISFDAATLEIWGPLLHGGRLVVMPPEVPTLAELGAALAEHRITTLWLTAGLFHQMVEGNLVGLAPVRQLLAGGDALSPAHVVRAARELPATQVINGYGPTENTTFSCCWQVVSEEVGDEVGATVSIGRPIAHSDAFIVDRSFRPVPPGVMGELLVGGDGLARCYLNRPDLTAERFVPHPFAQNSGDRIYRTGDRARWLPDGRIEFLGRIDRQVKIRGFRIEPGEVEAVLASLPGVAAAVVLVDGEGGDKRLVGYYVGAPAAPELRSMLRARLPEHLVPAFLVPVEAMPLTPNGKVDRRALARIGVAPAGLDEPGELPEGPVQELIAGIFRALLKIERVGAHTSFFDLGGHSLLATRLVARLREELGAELPLRAVFEAPSVAGLAAEVEKALGTGAAVLPKLVPVPRERPLPLSYAQERLWFLDQLEPGSSSYNVPAAVRLTGTLDSVALAAALTEIARRHEALRTTFAAGEPSESSGPVQVIAPSAPVPLPVTDLAGEADREERARALARAEALRPFDLAHGPLLRASLLRLAADEHVLLVAMHHIVSDGWSLGVFVRELGVLYGAFLDGKPSPLPELPVQYADFAVWQRSWLTGAELERQVAWWRDRLAGAPAVLELPSDRPRPAVQSYRGSGVPVALGTELSRALEALGRRSGATPFMVLLAAFQALLGRLSGQEDLVVGSPIANRRQGEVEGLIGFFVNTLVLRGDLTGDRARDRTGDLTFGALLARVREATLGAYAHQDVPFEKLVEALQPARSLAHAPLFQVMLALQNAPGGELELPGLHLSQLAGQGEAAKFDLHLALSETPAGIAGVLGYASDLFDGATAARWAGHLDVLLAAAVATPEVSWLDLPLLTAGERDQLIEWTKPGEERFEVEGEATLASLFAAQAARTPDAEALVSNQSAGEERLTYRELAGRSAALARVLRAFGVGPEERVAVCAERTADLVVALLAVLEAGGAYVPIDPAYPRERQLLMLEDSRAGVLLTQERLVETLPETGARVVLLDQPLPALPEDGDVAPPELLPDNLAYFIYTSGSTGRPKGVAIAHRSAVAMVRWARRTYSDAELAGVLLATSVCFDLSIYELFVPLSWGGKVIVAENALALPSLPARDEVTLVNTVPSALSELVRAGGVPASVTTINLAGEALQQSLVDRIYGLGTVERLWNLYGPSEDTTYSTGVLTRAGAAGVTIGTTLPGSRAFVVDRRGRPAPVGVPGELLLTGIGLARGYFDRPDLTAERFVPDGWSGEVGVRAYRTGDLVRWLPRSGETGELEFLGRIDHQVKVRGFRIELGEIEAALLAHPGIREAVVLAREDRPGDKRLVAYGVGQDGQAPETAALRDHLKTLLPEYMVPSAFVDLPKLPLSPNGKVDRKALLALGAPDLPADAGAHEGPRTPAEELVAALFADILGRERIGVGQSFFELGGHSLLATRVVSRLRETFGVELPLRRLFEAPTVAGLAAAVEAARADGAAAAPPVRRVDRDRPLPLSYAQERLWFLDQLEPGSASYNLPAAVRLRGDLDAGALGVALTGIVRRHEALRTTFAATNSGPVQVIAPPATVPLPLHDLSAEPDPGAGARAWLAAEAARPFDLAAGPLLRAALLRLGDGDHVLAVTMHHAVTDGWSNGIFVRELGALYAAFQESQATRDLNVGARLAPAREGASPSPTLTAEGVSSPLPELPVQYADYAVWQREWLAGAVLDRQLAWWRERLAGLPAVLELPADRPRPPVQSFRGGSVPLALPTGLSSDLAARSRERGATLYMALLAAFQAQLGRYLQGGEDIPIGSPVAGRTRAEVEPLIGFFVNTLVLRGDLSGDAGWGGLLARTRETTLGAWAHQDVPFEKLVEALQPERSLAHAPLFQVMLTFQNAPGGALELPGVTLEPVAAPLAAEKFDLSLTLWETADGLRGGLSYARDLFDEATAARWVGHLEVLLTAAVAAPETSWRDLPLLTDGERRQILVDWTATGDDIEVDGEATLAGLFAAQAARTPEAEALVVGDERLTYNELAGRAATLAEVLQGLGVGPEERVAVCAERNADLVVALLAVLAAGGAYVPIDPAYPRERQLLMLEDSRAGVLLTQERLVETLPETGAQVVLLDRPLPVLPEGERVATKAFLPDNLAYFIYTSGSTGRPKGVAIAHRSAVAMVRWARRTFSDAELAGVLLATSVCFDLSVYELFVPLSWGGKVILAENALALPGLPARDEVTLVNTVPSALSELVRSGGVPASVKTINLAGEALQQSLVDRIYALGTVDRLWNLYGPSEDTTYSTGVLTRAAAAGVTIGTTLPGSRAYVLDRQGQPAPIGVPGELLLTGIGLARGYFDRPDLTAERFVPDAWSGESGARAYRTGDLVRWLPRSGEIGELEFLGRIDHQVKVRGFRIELGEIEAALLAHPGVRETVVLAREDRLGDKRIVAYVVGHDGPAPNTLDLRSHLKTLLPEYMVPTAFVDLPKLPLSPNGKVDRKALPAPETPADACAVEAPRGPVEELIAEIWCEILGVDRVGLHASFFELGGHSLLATRVVSRLRETFGVELPLRRLFESPTVAGLATAVEAARAAGETPAPPLARVPRDRPLPLSFAQERLWFLDQFEPGRSVYNLPTALRFTGPLDLAALAASFAEVVRRHEALRTTFAVADGRAVQVIAPPSQVAASLPLLDLSALPTERREPLAARLAAAVAWRPFDLASGPLIRAAVLRLGADDHALLFAMHHIVSDGWSMGVLVREVAALYGAFTQGLPSPLPELPVQYADVATWQRTWLAGEALERQIAWWRERLAGAPPVLPLPLDHPRPPVHTFRGERRGRRLPAAVTAPLLALGRRHGATPFMTLLAAWDVHLARHTGELDLAVGTPIANRTRAEVEGLIGFFVNTLVLRTELPSAIPFTDLLARVRETALGAYAHQDLPFEKLVEQLAPERNLQHTPLFQVMFVYDEAPATPPGLPGLTPKPLAFENRTAKFDLTLIAHRDGDGLHLLLGYNTDIFRPDTIERMLDHLVHLVEAVVANPEQRVLGLPLLGTAESQQQLAEWNDTAGEVPGGLLHSRFQAWAEKRPQAPALVFGSESLSYGDLADRARQLAAVLRGLGVGPDVRVGLCLERSFELFVGLLGVLEAGGAYVPLDPANPAERLRFLLEDSAAPVLLTQRALAPSLEVGEGVTVLCLDEPLPAALALPAVPVDPDGLAYVIYTSGSTGTPNGVLVPHRGAVNLIRDARDLYQVGPDSRILQTASVGFDASVLEIFLALSHGGSLCLVREEERLTPSILTRILIDQGVSTAVVTPSLLSVLPEESLTILRSVSVGGEACSAELAARWARNGRRLLNCYGPTEATIFATVEILSGDGEPLIGRPVANVEAYVVDPSFAPMPAGVAGELVLGGVGLARGYLARPSKTAEKFVPDPFSDSSGKEGARLYRTGDLVRQRADGRIEFLGRIDDQVKVRGFRIELGEIESALLAHPDVASAVVLAPPDKTGSRRLVAYVAGRDGAEPADLRRFLETSLPDYMVPAHVLVLPALPVTPGGKVDRRALPNPEGDPLSGRAYVAPRTAAERFVAELWSQVLGTDRISALDDFFALGGSSIKGALLTNLLQERLGEYVYVVALFDAPTLEKLAAYLLKTYPEAMARVTGMRIEETREHRKVDPGMLLELRDIIEPLPSYPEKGARKNPRAAFILSPPRSGSTLLRVLLAGNPALFAPPELELLGFNTLQERKAVFTGRWELWTEGTIRALMEVYRCDAEEARRRMDEAEQAGLSIQDFYALLQQEIGTRLLVDKTPSYALDPATLERAEQDFDRPLYIHLLRHPYGMIRSFEKAKLEQVFFRPEHPFTRRQLAELIYDVSHENIFELLADVEPERQIVVRFEDMTRDPRAEMERLSSFLGVPFDERMLDPYADSAQKMTDGIHTLSKMVGDVKFHEHKSVDAKVAETWRREIAEDFLGDVTWRLAARLGYRERVQQFSPLVRLQEGTTGHPPLFLVHPVGGNVLCYAELARELADRPVYGLQSVGLGEGEEPQQTVEAMAERYLAEVRHIQPAGPYRLGGWSIGGAIAYEMAQQLTHAGEEVAHLTLFDTLAPGGTEAPLAGADETRLLLALAQDLAGLAGVAGQPGAASPITAADLDRLPASERLDALLTAASTAGALPPGIDREQVRRLWNVFRSNVQAVQSYRPEPYTGPVTLVRATRHPHAEETLGWDTLASGLTLREADADHYSLMRAPAVRELARTLGTA